MSKISALIDLGGSSVKVIICDSEQNKIYQQEIHIQPIVQGKHIFLSSEKLFDTVIEAMNLCSLKMPSGRKIDNIFISTLRQGFCLIRKDRELTPIYLNSDTSGDFARDDIEKYGKDKIYEETGHWFAPQLTLPKVINLFRKNPELNSPDTKLLFVHDWLIWRFTTQLVTEMSLVCAGQMARISERRIDFELLNNFNIPSSILPTVKKFNDKVGDFNNSSKARLKDYWLNAELHVGGGDSHFLHMGASRNELGKLVVSAGSSTPISLLNISLGNSNLLKPWKSTSFLSNAYFIEGNLGYPGTYYGWLSKNFKDSILEEEITLENLASASTIFGSCNMWNENSWESRPAFSILGDFSKSRGKDLLLGLTLDYAFALANQISEFKKDSFDINEVLITGGGSNQVLQKILFSLINLPVTLVSNKNSANNIFSIINQDIYINSETPKSINKLSDEISEYLKERAEKHLTLYSELEGTRKVLENVK